LSFPHKSISHFFSATQIAKSLMQPHNQNLSKSMSAQRTVENRNSLLQKKNGTAYNKG